MNNEPAGYFLYNEEYEEWEETHAGTPNSVPLYTHPIKELNDNGELVKNATYWKRQYNLMATQNDNLKSGLYHANEQIKYLESHPVELTDEEIWDWFKENTALTKESALMIARAILLKANEK